MWLRKTCDPNQKIILFDYASSRRADVAILLLSDYQGCFQVDECAGYNKTAKTEGVIQLGCFTRARRKFIDAQKVAPNKKAKSVRPAWWYK